MTTFEVIVVVWLSLVTLMAVWNHYIHRLLSPVD